MFISHFFKQGVFILKDFRNFKFSSNITSNAPECQGVLLHRSIEKYLFSLTPNQRSVAQYLLRFQKASVIKLRNQTIAKSVGCSEKTVTRATNKFKEDGFIFKAQANRYAPNNFALSSTAKNSRRIYISSINEPIYTTRNVPQNNSYKLYLYNKPIPLARARAKVELIDGDGFGFLSKTERERKERVLKGIQMLNKEQKEWVIKNGKDPRVKEYVMGPKVKPLLITPLIEQCTEVLKLNKREQMKLVAFPEEALDYAYQQAKKIVDGTIKSPPIKDRMGWFIFLATDFCKKNNLDIDWKWYFDICQVLGIEPILKNEAAKPLVEFQESKPKPFKHSGFSPYEAYKPKPKSSPEERISFLEVEIKHAMLFLSECEKKVAAYNRESIIFMTKHLHECTEELSILANIGKFNDQQISIISNIN